MCIQCIECAFSVQCGQALKFVALCGVNVWSFEAIRTEIVKNIECDEYLDYSDGTLEWWRHFGAVSLWGIACLNSRIPVDCANSRTTANTCTEKSGFQQLTSLFARHKERMHAVPGWTYCHCTLLHCPHLLQLPDPHYPYGCSRGLTRSSGSPLHKKNQKLVTISVHLNIIFWLTNFRAKCQ